MRTLWAQHASHCKQTLFTCAHSAEKHLFAGRVPENPHLLACASIRQPRKLSHARLALQFRPQAIKHQPLSAAHLAKSALQLVGTQDQAAQPVDFPQQGANVGRIGALADFVEVGAGEFGAHAGDCSSDAK